MLATKIEVECSCGMRQEVASRFAGCTVECPGCLQRIEVAREVAEPKSTNVYVLCECGQRLKAPLRMEGARGRCPCCSRPIVVHGGRARSRKLSTAEWLSAR